jgi:hypothetical protein
LSTVVKGVGEKFSIISSLCHVREVKERVLNEILALYKKSMRMMINLDKYLLCFNKVEIILKEEQLETFQFQEIDFNEGFKYLGFWLKPNSYKK